MKNYSLLILAYFLAIFNLTAQDATNNVTFSGETPEYAIVGGKSVLKVDINVVDDQPANLMIGIITMSADGNPGIQPAVMKIIPLTDVAPYTKHVVDTIAVSAEMALSSNLTDGQTYAYFCTILTSTFSPVDQEYNKVTVVDATTGNHVNFSPAPYGVVMQDFKIALGVDLTITDSQPANLMIGIITMDADGNPGIQPTVMKIIPLKDVAPYTKQVIDTIAVSAGMALSSELTDGQTYAYFCTVLTSTFSPVDQKYSGVSVVEKANSVSFTSVPDDSAVPGDSVLVSVDLTVADAAPGVLMTGIITMDADGNPGMQPVVFKITSLTDVAPYVKQVTNTIAIPTDLALSSSLSNGEKYMYFCTLLAPDYMTIIDQKYSEVTISNGTSVNDQLTNGIWLYPNPTKDILHLMGLQSNEKIGIYNVAGNLLLNTVLSSDKINVSELQPGVYLLKGETFVTKFIKQ